VRSPLPEEEGAVETVCNELTTTPIPCPPVPVEVRSSRKWTEIEPGKKGEEGGGGVLRFWFYFSLPYPDSIGNRLNYFPQVVSVLPVMVIGE